MPQTDAFDTVIPYLIQAGYLMASMAGFLLFWFFS